MTNYLDHGNPKVTLNSNILDVVVPKEMERNVSTGMVHADVLFSGDGITPSTVTLFTGIPGSGKTSFGIQLADAITGTGNVAMYNTGEESLYQVRKVTKRFNLKHGFVPSYETDVDSLIAKAEQLRLQNKGKQLFLFQDSLQTLLVTHEARRGRPQGNLNNQVEAAARLTAWAKKTYTIVFIIGQVNKDGVFAGKQEIKHIIDCHLHLAVDMDRKSETHGRRIAEMQKNRTGSSGLYFEYEIGAAGVRFIG